MYLPLSTTPEGLPRNICKQRSAKAATVWYSKLQRILYYMLVPSISELCEEMLHVLGVRPCLWQIKVVVAFLKGEKDIVTIAATSAGKTLTFQMPLIF